MTHRCAMTHRHRLVDWTVRCDVLEVLLQEDVGKDEATCQSESLHHFISRSTVRRRRKGCLSSSTSDYDTPCDRLPSVVSHRESPSTRGARTKTTDWHPTDASAGEILDDSMGLQAARARSLRLGSFSSVFASCVELLYIQKNHKKEYRVRQAAAKHFGRIPPRGC